MKTTKAGPSPYAKILVLSASGNLVAATVPDRSLPFAAGVVLLATIACWVLDNSARSRRLTRIIASLRAAPNPPVGPCQACAAVSALDRPAGQAADEVPL